MTATSSLDELWESPPPAQRMFEPDQLAGHPDAAQRYLEHAIAPGTPLASAVRLRMHGEMKTHPLACASGGTSAAIVSSRRVSFSA
jgi:hypothetical protein